MPEPCGRTFDEALLSGHLDGALVQGDEQRVRVHLEDCGTCRTLVEELAEVREATMSSTFNIPGDHEWSEAPRHQRRIDILADYEKTHVAPPVPGA